MKKEIIRKQRTKRWTLTSKGKLQPEILFEVRRRLSKEERKNQGRIDDEEILATVEFSALDEFKCSEMKVSICSEKGALITQNEWNEIMKFLLQDTVPSWQAAFVLVNKQNLPANLLPAIFPPIQRIFQLATFFPYSRQNNRAKSMRIFQAKGQSAHPLLCKKS